MQADAVVWYTPFKKAEYIAEDFSIKILEQPKAVVIDVNALKNDKKKHGDYPIAKMVSVELKGANYEDNEA